MNTTRQPALRNQKSEMIPTALVRAMFALALATLGITTIAVVTDRPTVGQPKPSQVVSSQAIILEGRDAQAVTVRNTDGTVLADLPHGGFITVIQNAMARERLVHRIEGNPPLYIVRYANGRLVAEDPATGWSAELYAFGGENKAAFERLLDQ
ncbi:photosynthetic complex assembly protein PuhC [Paragemmobacter ruber]|uniref:Photosynthetic complex assembly protein n=1 Tax=Paragemmobacter ruber TaxID=1985673 RepID=A0ABW9Y6W6_9RHOB|nr:photosynthetic complex assembly protein PuhC [Rhodobacter ruber]NBE08259.1 photosynthetic complex assembly protein [Rhodobacter ruber]